MLPRYPPYLQPGMQKSLLFLILWPWPLTHDLEKVNNSGHSHYQCVPIWDLPLFEILKQSVFNIFNTPNSGTNFQKWYSWRPVHVRLSLINIHICKSKRMNWYKRWLHSTSGHLWAKTMNKNIIEMCLTKPNMGRVMEVQLSCYLVLLSTDSKTR